MDGDDGREYAVVLFREEGCWQAGLLPERLTEDLDGLLSVLRQQTGEIGSIGLINVFDEFFVALRVRPGQEQMLLSDVTAAVAWDLAREVCDRLDLDTPGDDDLEDVWPAGDLGMFSDLGVDEMEIGVVLSDPSAYADEQLLALAQRLGFADAYESALEGALR